MIVQGWKLVWYGEFERIYQALMDDVKRLKRERDDWQRHPKAIVFAAIQKLMLSVIPTDPNRADAKLKGDLSAWRRVKFLGRLRLFYRFSTKEKVIAYVWVNDENTLRKEGSHSDPYVMFTKMIMSGNPPTDLLELLKICKDIDVDER